MTTVPIANPVRKGEVVAVEVAHSYHTAQMKRTYYTRFHLATVAQASREGLARKVEMTGSFHSVDVARVGRVLTLNGRADVQEAAKALRDTIKRPTDNEWKSAEDLRAAILAHMQGEA